MVSKAKKEAGDLQGRGGREWWVWVWVVLLELLFAETLRFVTFREKERERERERKKERKLKRVAATELQQTRAATELQQSKSRA